MQMANFEWANCSQMLNSHHKNQQRSSASSWHIKLQKRKSHPKKRITEKEKKTFDAYTIFCGFIPWLFHLIKWISDTWSWFLVFFFSLRARERVYVSVIYMLLIPFLLCVTLNNISPSFIVMVRSLTLFHSVSHSETHSFRKSSRIL